MADMKKRPVDENGKQVTDDSVDISHSNNNAYEVEEQVFVRQNYENTSSFEMDIEKAKAMAATSQQLAGDSHSESSVAAAEDHDSGETDAIKQSLAELREMELRGGSDDEYDDKPGLLQKIKNLFR